MGPYFKVSVKKLGSQQFAVKSEYGLLPNFLFYSFVGETGFERQRATVARRTVCDPPAPNQMR